MEFQTKRVATFSFSRFSLGLCLLSLLAFLFCAGSLSFAEVAEKAEMDQVCANWLTSIVEETGSWAGTTSPQIADAVDIIEDGRLLGRIYSISPQGYIIVPVLKELAPVKAYSDANDLDIYEEDGFGLMIRQVLSSRLDIYEEVYGSLDSKMDDLQPLFKTENKIAWDRFNVSPAEFASKAAANPAEPLIDAGPLLTSTWHQGYPYNSLCPDGDGDRCVVGCVATAAAQIMWYHQWPPQGTGSHSYYWGGDNSCGGSTPGQTLSADFSDPYDYTPTNANVAEISYEMGVAFDMDYGACGSGAYTLNGYYVFPTYFQYDESAARRYRDDYTPSSWFTLIKNQINQGYPTLYRIYSHAIVCDGWRVSGGVDQYHFNYGWGGSNNSWYAVDGLYCPWSGCDPMVEGMVINIIPKTAKLWLGSDLLSDDIYGDGDGIPEAGETVQFSVTIANYGSEAVSDVSAVLFTEDGSLTITDANSTIGYIGPRDSTDNESDPFELSIPADYTARLDTFFVELTYNAGANVDTVSVEKAIGGVKVLLVDDDEYSNAETYYQTSLDNLRIPHDIWIHAPYATPDSAYLSKYDVVIWYTGGDRSSPLNTDEIALMKGYMNAGGNLLLSGQGIAQQLANFDADFLNNYLKADYVSSMMIPIVAPAPGGQVMTEVDSVAIQGAGGAANQTSPDIISAVGGGIGEMSYYGLGDFAAVSYSGNYHSVFFGFGVEAIVNGDTRWMDRDSILVRVLDFCNYERPDEYPYILDVTVSPGEIMNLTDHTPEISWTFTDKLGLPQTEYQVQVDSDNNWESIDMWNGDIISGSATSVPYGGAALVDGAHYYIRVRGFNGALWSGWNYREMRMNSLPATPENLQPFDMSSVTEQAPYLTHDNANDAEDDEVTYDYQVYADASMTSLVVEMLDQAEGGGPTTSCQVTGTLSDDTEYFWRVRGNDPYENGSWSDLASFWVNSSNDLPVAFDLVAPEDGVTIEDSLPTVSWTASDPGDLHDGLHYDLYYATDPDFASVHIRRDILNTEYTFTENIQLGEVYYWKVVAIDNFLGETWSSSVYSFNTLTYGDANADGVVNVGDAVYIINYVFNGGAAPIPVVSGDANCDGAINVGDAVFIINYIFKGGDAPGCI